MSCKRCLTYSAFVICRSSSDHEICALIREIINPSGELLLKSRHKYIFVKSLYFLHIVSVYMAMGCLDQQKQALIKEIVNPSGELSRQAQAMLRYQQNIRPVSASKITLPPLPTFLSRRKGYSHNNAFNSSSRRKHRQLGWSLTLWTQLETQHTVK